MSEELKSCPFCGGEADFILTDSEGNLRPESYLDEPWSGVGYLIDHNNEKNVDCPIANHPQECVGSFIYDSKQDAIKAWNTRTDISDQYRQALIEARVALLAASAVIEPFGKINAMADHKVTCALDKINKLLEME
jgi:hypothetical protein